MQPWTLIQIRITQIIVHGLILLNTVCSGLPVKGHKDKSGDPVELWLEDYTRAKVVDPNGMLADGPLSSVLLEIPARCPAEPTDVPGTQACQQTACTSDLSCAYLPGHKCCFNGCVKTCLRALPPPSVVDWVVEPPRDPVSGQSWLMRLEDVMPQTAPLETTDVVDCTISTKQEDDSPFCPDGYVCHLYAMKHATNNRGHHAGICILDDLHTDSRRQFRLMSGRHGAVGCDVGPHLYRDGGTFSYHGHHCKCNQGDVTCRVGDL